MGNRLNATIRGIVPNAELWRPVNLVPRGSLGTDSEYTERNPRPGTTVSPSADARLITEVSNAQSVDLQFEVDESGPPTNIGAAVTYTDAPTFTNQRRGWNQPNLLIGWLAQDYITGGSPPDNVSCVTIPTTQLVVAVGTGVDPRTFDPEAQTWTSGVDPLVGGTPGALVVLPGTERVISVLGVGSGGGSLAAAASDDSGATWFRYSDRMIRDPSAPQGGITFVADDPKGLALADGTVIVVATSNVGTMGQIASADLATTFTLVEEEAAFGSHMDVGQLADGSIIVGYISNTGSFPTVRVVGSAFDKISEAPSVSVESIALDSMSTVVDYDGVVYVFGVPNANPEQVLLWRSTTSGTTWEKYRFGVIDTGTPGSHVVLVGACATGGMILLQHRWVTAPGTQDNSIGTILVGGWSNSTTGQSGSVPATSFDSFGFDTLSARESNTWIPIELPSNQIYTLSGSAGTLVAPGELEIVTVAAQSRNRRILTTTSGTGVMAQFRVDAGGSQTAADTGFTGTAADSVQAFQYEIRADTAGYRVRDTFAGTDIATVNIDMTTNLQIFVDLSSSGTVTVLHRRPGATLWTLALSSTSLADGGGGIPTSIVTFGHRVVTTSTTHWQLFCFAEDLSFTSLSLFERPDGKPVGSSPYPLLEVGDATTKAKAFLALKTGPGVRDEIYKVPISADHDVGKLFPTVSPSRDATYQSAGKNDTVRIAVERPNESRPGGSWSLVLGILNANVRTIKLLSGGGAATLPEIGEIDLGTGFINLNYERTGDIIRPTAGTAAASRWIQSMEFAGGHVQGITGNPKILANSAGGWFPGADVIPEFRLAGITGAEPTTGVCTLVAPSGVLVVHLDGLVADHQTKFAIQISAGQTTAGDDGFFQIGTALLGSIVAFGKQWSNGWQYEVRPNTRFRTTPYGTTFGEERGPEIRVLTMGWPDGTKRQFVEESLDPDYIGPTPDGTPLVARDDAMDQIVGLMRESASFSVPVIALSKVPDASGLTITDPRLWLFGHVRGTAQANNVNGNEAENEFARIEQIQIVESR